MTTVSSIHICLILQYNNFKQFLTVFSNIIIMLKLPIFTNAYETFNAFIDEKS